MPRFVISKEFAFSAAHHLEGLPPEHPCARQHGHGYVVVIELSADTLDNRGFVRDYGELRIVKQYLDGELDHRDLNEVLPFNPTAENIARHVYELFSPIFPELSGVAVSETPKTWAWYRPR